jgi:hypothetical protein
VSWVWKDREVGAAEIADAVPGADRPIALPGRFLALRRDHRRLSRRVLVGGILLQTLAGLPSSTSIGLYLRVLFGLNLASTCCSRRWR